MDDPTLEELIADVMGAGAAYAAENIHEFRGSQRPLVEHFKPFAASFVRIRPQWVEEVARAAANHKAGV